MKNTATAFSYKSGNSFVHRMKAWKKILLIPAVNILFFYLPFYFSVAFLIFQVILASCLKFTFKEQIKDVKPIIYYGVLLYFTSFIAHFCSDFFSQGNLNFEIFKSALIQSAKITFENKETVKLLVKLLCVMQSVSIIFRTSTSLQIREGAGTIEGAIRKILPVSKKNKFTDLISMMICFIPLVYRNWNQCKNAWFARGGKASVKMYISILPVFFSVGIKQAYNSSRAILIRS